MHDKDLVVEGYIDTEHLYSRLTTSISCVVSILFSPPGNVVGAHSRYDKIPDTNQFVA